jgi:tricorn protease interacting factor F2/3
MGSAGHETIGDNVRPVNYRLTIDTNLRTFKFKGSVAISVSISKSTNEIKLYAKELKIKSVRVQQKGEMQDATCSAPDKKQVITLKLKKPVSGSAVILMEYEGANNDRLYGFYRSMYDYKGKKVYFLTSQFEAPNARAAFPCFDEPDFKATFDLSLTIDKNLDAISNMPVKSTKSAVAKRKTVTFETTPVMSTYLLYLGVGKFDYLAGKIGSRTLRVVTTPGKKNLGHIALEFAKRLVAHYESYFGIKYPLPKLDLIAVPDFAEGAMENWGAITFREVGLLGDEKRTATSMKQVIATYVAHEIAHQWFGDLVTMKWWDDMWLNESFARYMEFKAPDKLYPEWKKMQDFYNDTITSALGADSLRNTHPISVNVNSVVEIEELFDEIGYDKGASVLFMLENYVGSEIFRKGLHRYLDKHKYSNATKTDLWSAIQQEAKAASGKEFRVVEVMEDWINKAGYPMINVTRNSDGSFELEQEKFTLAGNIKGEVWKIPINYLTSDGPATMLLDTQSTRIKTKSEWIKLNYKQTGFYRVRYESYNLARLGKMFKKGELGDIDAWGLESDLYVLARTGKIPVDDYLTFITRYCMNVGYPINANIAGHLTSLTSLAYTEAFVSRIKKVSISFDRKLLEKMNWVPRPDDSTVEKKLRVTAAFALAFAGDKEAQDKLNRMFDDFASKRADLDPDFRPAVFQNTALFNGDAKKFKMLYDLYEKGDLPEIKMRALESLPMFADLKLVKKILDDMFTDKVRLQDTPYLFRYSNSNPYALRFYFAWVRQNWKKIMKLYNDPSSRMLRDPIGSLSGLSDQESRDAFEKFFLAKSNNREYGMIEARKTLERIDANIKFMEANRR